MLLIIRWSIRRINYLQYGANDSRTSEFNCRAQTELRLVMLKQLPLCLHQMQSVLSRCLDRVSCERLLGLAGLPRRVADARLHSRLSCRRHHLQVLRCGFPRRALQPKQAVIRAVRIGSFKILALVCLQVASLNIQNAEILIAE